MKDSDFILCYVLAVSDATWLPVRRFTAPLPANVYLARVGFRKTGVPWRSGEAGEAARKAAQRRLEAAASAGLVTVHRPRRGKNLGVRLTDEGDARARALCGLPGMADGLSLLGEVDRLSASAGAWVPETSFADAGAECSESELMLTENLALPVLTRGWLESGATVRGNAAFRVAEAGRTYLVSEATLAALDNLEDDEPPTDAQARLFYEHALEDVLRRFAHATPEDAREIGLVPLSLSVFAHDQS